MGFQMMEIFLDPSCPLKVKGQSQTLKTFEVEYLENGTR